MYKSATFALALILAATYVDAKKDKPEKDSNNSDDSEFLSWAGKNGKSYKDSDEFALRKQNWKEAKAEVDELNSNSKKAKYELNFIADMTAEERQNLLGAFEDINEGEGRRLADEWEPMTHGRNLQVAGEVDWSENNLTPVKNQGSCGSCVAFAVTTIAEGLESIKTGNAPVRLSEQHQVDCAARNADNVSTDYGNYGCGGGWIYKYFNFNIGEGAVNYDDYRAYNARDGTCEHNPANVSVQGATRGYVSGTV